MPVSVERWVTISGSAGYRPLGTCDQPCMIQMNRWPWTRYGITMARSTGHPQYDPQRLRAVGDSDLQTRIREKSCHGYLQWVTRTGYPGRLGLVDRLASTLCYEYSCTIFEITISLLVIISKSSSHCIFAFSRNYWRCITRMAKTWIYYEPISRVHQL